MKIYNMEEAYNRLNDRQRLEFESLIKKHFPNDKIMIDCDSANSGLMLRSYKRGDSLYALHGGMFDTYSKENPFDYSMEDLAYDVNVFFAEIYGDDYILGSIDDIEKFIAWHSDEENNKMYDAERREKIIKELDCLTKIKDSLYTKYQEISEDRQID